MSEKLSGIEQEQYPTIPQSVESRFGDKGHLLGLMERGSVEFICPINDYIEEAVEHRNEVDVVAVDAKGYRNETDLVEITENGEKISCVFKPGDGEDRDFLSYAGQNTAYHRERASYLVSEHFGLDIIPPTIIRTVNGRIGALQLFVPHKSFKMGKAIIKDLDESEWSALLASDDIARLNILDWIICNGDRHDENYLIRVDDEGKISLTDGQAQIIAIDHGLALNIHYYGFAGRNRAIYGPYQPLTFDNRTSKPVRVNIPVLLKEQVEKAMANNAPLAEALSELGEIPTYQVDAMWERAEELVRRGCFLSFHNRDYVKK